MRLRIISGEFKRRLIETPQSVATRPMTDRLRETLFNIIVHRFPIYDANVLDLFAGSGSIGLEALSRGAEHVTFVENGPHAIPVLEKNIVSLQVQHRTTVVRTDALGLSSLKSNKQYDFIFADPPFASDDIHTIYHNLINNDFCSHGGVIIIQRSIESLEKDIEAFGIEPNRIIGGSALFLARFEG